MAGVGGRKGARQPGFLNSGHHVASPRALPSQAAWRSGRTPRSLGKGGGSPASQPGWVASPQARGQEEWGRGESPAGALGGVVPGDRDLVAPQPLPELPPTKLLVPTGDWPW